MNKKQHKAPAERKCVWIPKESYAAFVAYCEERCINLPKWLVRLGYDAMNQKEKDNQCEK
jgi:hypothetical protein